MNKINNYVGQFDEFGEYSCSLLEIDCQYYFRSNPIAHLRNINQTSVSSFDPENTVMILFLFEY